MATHLPQHHQRRAAVTQELLPPLALLQRVLHGRRQNKGRLLAIKSDACDFFALGVAQNVAKVDVEEAAD